MTTYRQNPNNLMATGMSQDVNQKNRDPSHLSNADPEEGIKSEIDRWT